jgi:hypothetical protein
VLAAYCDKGSATCGDEEEGRAAAEKMKACGFGIGVRRVVESKRWSLQLNEGQRMEKPSARDKNDFFSATSCSGQND